LLGYSFGPCGYTGLQVKCQDKTGSVQILDCTSQLETDLRFYIPITGIFE